MQIAERDIDLQPSGQFGVAGHFGAAVVGYALALRANKRETFDWLKFTLEGEGERTHGYSFRDTAFA